MYFLKNMQCGYKIIWFAVAQFFHDIFKNTIIFLILPLEIFTMSEYRKYEYERRRIGRRGGYRLVIESNVFRIFTKQL